jgi:hypothetical protein
MGHGVNPAVGTPGVPHPSVDELCHVECSWRGMCTPCRADGCTVPVLPRQAAESPRWLSTLVAAPHRVSMSVSTWPPPPSRRAAGDSMVCTSADRPLTGSSEQSRFGFPSWSSSRRCSLAWLKLSGARSTCRPPAEQQHNGRRERIPSAGQETQLPSARIQHPLLLPNARLLAPAGRTTSPSSPSPLPAGGITPDGVSCTGHHARLGGAYAAGWDRPSAHHADHEPLGPGNKRAFPPRARH